MQNYLIGADLNQWQDFDPVIFKQNNVDFIFLAFNIYTGELKINPNFISQYNKTINAGLVCIPYLVYSPNYTAQSYYNWILANMPINCNAIMIDTEIIISGMSVSTYTSKYNEFIGLIKSKWIPIIYTGAGYLQILNFPKDLSYVWAEYPSIFYPSSETHFTWDQVRNDLVNFNGPLNENLVPGQLLAWQISGDKLLLPGCSSSLDVDVYFGDLNSLQKLANGIVNPIPVPTNTDPVLIDQQNWNGAIYQKFNINIVRPTYGTDNVNYYVISVPINQIDDIVFDNHVAVAETSWFTSHHDVDFATNGYDGFYTDGTGTHLAGFAAYHGQAFGKLNNEETVFIDQNMNFTLDTVPLKMWSACSFPNLLIKDGQILPTDKTKDDIRARTSYGVTKDKQTLIILVVDGLDYFSHHGFNYLEVQNLLLSLNCYLAWMSDGGGSTTLCEKNLDGSATVINVPSGENADGERSVAIHCGIKMKSSVTPPIISTLNGILSINGFQDSNIVLNK